jgi:hypothetical protein
MSDLRDRMFRAMEEHGLGWIDNGKPTAHCWCGYQPQMGESWHMHVADAVIAELGLRYQLAPEGGPWTGHHRYLTDWKWEPTNE